MEIPNPRRILAVSRPDHGLLDLLQGFTGSKPTLSDPSTIAGTTHPYPITTPYYTASIPIWLDEISSPPAWSKEFLAPEAKEVLSALGAFVVSFKKPLNQAELEEVKELLRCVGEVVKEGCGMMWDGVAVAVGMPRGEVGGEESVSAMKGEEWEDLCQEEGFEWIDWEEKGRNEYSGEVLLRYGKTLTRAETQGLERLKEALEANDWEAPDELGDAMGLEDFEGEDDDENGSLGFNLGPEDRAEMEMEMFGMKRAIYQGVEGVDEEGAEEEVGDGEDDEAEKLQAMMLKMQAVRDLGADMPEAERKRFAAKAVNDIMKKL
ncbi:hypothetical protein BDZ45DRAFT_700353 [Acephala macrosclerotiorum]|nr:hypothetical protein BDZ45DRAFT_700353 [Acephala macrosclerotiorum]